MRANQQQTRVVAALVAVAVVGFFMFSGGSGSSSGHDAYKNCPKTGKRYGIMFDAGSTGSRVHAYTFDFHQNGKIDLLHELFEQVKPGLSSYKNNPQEAADSLRGLLDASVKEIPPEAHKCTPIELKATAGLRLIGKEKADAILAAVYNLFKQYPFYVKGPESVVVMDGKDEGPYAWMTVNFLLGTMTKTATEKTAAIIDMGGASTQIVFRPDEDAVMRKVSDRQVFDVQTETYETKVYTHSHLGYGLKEAGKAMMNVAKDAGAGSAFSCFPHGVSEKLGDVEASNDNGGQDFNKCLATAEGILKKSAKCSASSCSFNGIAQPQLASSFTGPVYAFSYFYDRMEAFMSNDGVSSVRELREMASGVCEGKEAPYAEHNKGTMCMDLVYLYSLLRTGYDMPDNTPLYIKKKIRGYETAWTLGAMMAAMK